MWCLMFMRSSWPWQMASTVMFCCVLRCAVVSPLVWSINLYHAAVFIIHSRRSVPHVLCCPWEKDTVSLCFSQPKEERIILEANESNFVSYAQSLTVHSMVALNDHLSIHDIPSIINGYFLRKLRRKCDYFVKVVAIFDACPLFANF